MGDKVNINISIGYAKSHILYENINLMVELGGIHNIVGENGTGKSTFYKTLIGVIPPIEGEVPKAFSKNMAIVSDYVSLPGELFVKDIVDFIGNEKLEYMKLKYRTVWEIIHSLKDQSIKTLSTGQKRMLEIFTILSTNKTILILDEACNGLDYRNKSYFIQNIKKLSSEHGVTIFNTSHNLEDVVDFGGYVYLMDKNAKKIRAYEGEMTIEKLNLYMKSIYGDVQDETIV